MNTTESRPEKSTPGGGEHRALFGPPPLFEGEDSKIYDQLVTEIFNAVTPADILEEIWLRDVVDLTIDVLRLRRLKADLMNANALKGPTENLATIFWAARRRRLWGKGGLRASRKLWRRSTKFSRLRA